MPWSARAARHAIGLRARAHDDVIGGECAGGRVHDTAVAASLDPDDLAVELDAAAARGDVVGECPCDGGVIDHRGAGRNERGPADRLGLSFADAGCADHVHARDTVGDGALMDRRKPHFFRLVERDDQLAALEIGEVLLGAEVFQQPDAAAAQTCFEASRFVVEPGVDDSGVVPGLVSGDPGFLLQHGHVAAGKAADEFAADGGADDPRAHDDVRGAHSSARNRSPSCT